MLKKIKNRDFAAQIKWEGDLKDDCLANWSGLLLRAERMEEDNWWWYVYDVLDNEIQIDSSNNYNSICKDGNSSRQLAEQKAKEYLKINLCELLSKEQSKTEIEHIMLALKNIKITPFEILTTLRKEFRMEHYKSKNLIFSSPIWKNFKENSEYLTKLFEEVAIQEADNVEYTEDSIIATYGTSKKPNTIWNKLKSIFKKRKIVLFLLI